MTNTGLAPDILGLDGCRGGWVVAVANSDDLAAVHLHMVPSILDALDLGSDRAVVAVDMPIGLLDAFQRGGRECDRQTRAMLGPRRSSVFSSPVRPAVFAETYAEACELSRNSAPGAGALSRQSFGLAPRIRELDTLLRADPALRTRVIETHPEAAFMALAGEPLPPKKELHGRSRRTAVLALHGVPDPTSIPPEGSKSSYQADDLIDAAVCLLVAREVARGTAISIPEKPPVDRFGIPMQILTPRP